MLSWQQEEYSRNAFDIQVEYFHKQQQQQQQHFHKQQQQQHFHKQQQWEESVNL